MLAVLIPGATSSSKKGTGYCISHAKEQGLSIEYNRCRESGCYKYVYRMGYCIAHGRERGIEIDNLYKKCEEIECRKFAAKGTTFCKLHAKERGFSIVSSTRKCSVEGCEKSSQKGGYCRTHGREAGLIMQYKRCEYGDCDKHIARREGGKGYCTLHAREMAQGGPTFAPSPVDPVVMSVPEVVMRPMREEHSDL